MMRAGIFTVVYLCGAWLATAQITSTFDTDRDGWVAIDNQSGPNPTYQPNGGNPGGFISVIDGVGGTATYFVAPSKFLANKSAYFGGTLQFDLQVSVTPNSSTAGVRLRGGGITLVKLLTPEFSLPAIAPAWSTYSFRLDESVAWRVTSTTGPLATPAQIQSVLDSLTELAINGEYSTAAADGGGLDNVMLTSAADTDELEIYNGLSPGVVGQNDFFFLENIELRTDTQNNTVTIYNRWGSEIFKTTDYNNTTRVFTGLTNDGKKLPSGTYFYKIEFESNRKAETGYLVLKW